MQPGVCALCCANTLLCESHIFPRFLYDPIRDDQNKLHLVTSHTMRPVRSKKQSGVWEYLLCPTCEGKFNRYETYYKNDYQTSRPIEYAKFEVYLSLSYEMIRLFQISVLWRMSISSDPLFEYVDLPDAMREDLRDRLHREDPGEEYEYPCLWQKIRPPRKRSGSAPWWGSRGIKAFDQPRLYNKKVGEVIVFVLHDQVWCYALSQSWRRIGDGLIRKSGLIRMPVDRHFERSPFYRLVLEKLQTAVGTPKIDARSSTK